MRWAYLALLVGCVTQDAASGGDPNLAESQAEVTVCPAGTWCVETSPAASSTQLHAVWAASADVVFAVGDAGVILRRTNDSWTAMASGTRMNLRAIWGVSSSDVWVGGAAGTVLHFDGTAWSPVAGLTTDVNAIWAAGARDIWFVGQGTVAHWDGTGFSTTSLGVGGSLLAVSGTGPGDVWVTGESANVRHFTGAWSTQTTGIGATMFAVLAISSNDVWVSASGSGREAAHWNGTKWTVVSTSRGVFNFMSALDSNDIWGVGLVRRIGHWDGTAWTVEQPLGTVGSLWGVTTVPGHAWLVGDDNLIAHRSL